MTHSFSFKPDPEAVSILQKRSTNTKVRIDPIEAYVDAFTSQVGDSDMWQASVNSLPQSSSLGAHDHSATLCLYKGELGQLVGTVKLGDL